jgi:hypothetical protein
MAESSIVQMLVSGQNDLDWFNSNIDALKSRYDNKFIAFHNKQIIDSDSKLDALMRKLDTKNIDTSGVLVRFVSKVKAIL